MATFLPAPQMPRNAMLNFQPLNSAIDDYQNAARDAEQETYRRKHDAEVMGMRRQEFAASQEDRQQRQRTARVQSLAGLAQLVDSEQDPNQRAARWNTILQSDPRLARSLPEQYRDPINGPKFLIAEARGYQDPLKTQQTQADLDYKLAATAKLQREASGQATDYGKTGSVFQGQDGQFYTIQFGSDGSRRIEPVVTGGQNLTPAKGVQVVGDEVISAATGAPVRNVGSNIAGAEAAKVTGQAAGQAQVGLPGARGMAAKIAREVQAIKSDPYLPKMLGPVNSHLPNVTSNAARMQGRFDQTQSGAFLEARQLLKGGGAITDYEGLKAERAFVRMNTAQTVEDFTAALDEFNEAVQAGVMKLEQQAGAGRPVPQAMPAPQQGPQPGMVEDGFRFRGGDPSNPNNWEPVS